ncbi:hypothetical protein WEI85_48080 [Actinomycetes bacterium KLBMP 9797]
MPSYLHEALVEMFRDRPALAAEVLAGPLRIAVPPFEHAGVSSGDLTDVTPTEYRADVVVTLSAGDTVVLAVVVEAQLGVDRRKRRSWPAYVATLHARLGCPVALLVVCADPRVAAWCAAPIAVGHPGFVLTPLVLGPHQVPVVADAEMARQRPELAVLSAMAHGGDAEQKPVLEALLAALSVMDHDHAGLYADIVLAALPAAAREYLEGLMAIANYQYQSDFARRYFSQGEAKALLAVLEARGFAVSDAIREKIFGCTDPEQIDRWVRQAVTVRKVDDLFE